MIGSADEQFSHGLETHYIAQYFFGISYMESKSLLSLNKRSFIPKLLPSLQKSPHLTSLCLNNIAGMPQSKKQICHPNT